MATDRPVNQQAAMSEEAKRRQRLEQFMLEALDLDPDMHHITDVKFILTPGQGITLYYEGFKHMHGDVAASMFAALSELHADETP